MESEDIGLNEYFDEMDRVESVVGGASASECTYDQGYLSRQAVYSCLDCTAPSSNILAGFCHACRINCHRTHNVEEIYTKRNFRCDCGTLPQLLCSLKPDVDTRNEDNQYSQNFKGTYCRCARPYPDTEHPEMDTVEMMQCFVCEDWFHATHLNTVVPEKYEEMACAECAGKHSFLSAYAQPEVENLDVEGSSNEKESVLDSNEGKITSEPDTAKCTPSTAEVKEDDGKSETLVNACSPPQPVDLKRPPSDADAGEPPSKRKKTSGASSCKLGMHGSSTSEVITRALFFDGQFRDSICKCPSCLDLYKEQHISFVADPNDSLNKYEEKAHTKRQEEEAELTKTLESLPHQAKCDVARAIGSLKDTLHGLISKFATEGKDAVGRAEIVEAFKTMAAETKSVDPSIFDNVGK